MNSPQSDHASPGSPPLKWSWKLVRVAGIDVYVHATFVILILWLALSYWATAGLPAVVSGVGFILLLFGCVALHEFGHALTARRFGIRTRHITLLPIGGVADLEKMPDDPRQEILVALAGPAVNLVIAAVLWFWLMMSGSLVPGEVISVASGPLLHKLIVLNIILAVFNLLPAFPMDGGRVLRAALAMRMGRVQATRTAARIGQGLALWLGLIGLLYNPFLIFIALFVWIGAAAEAEMETVRSSLAHVTTGEAMLTEFHTLSPQDSLARVIELTLEGSQKDFPVMMGEEMVGVLTQDDLLRGLQADGEHGRVVDWMQQNIHTADIDEPLNDVLERLRESRYPLLAVMKHGRIAGIINLENIMELIRIQTMLEARQEARRTFGA